MSLCLGPGGRRWSCGIHSGPLLGLATASLFDSYSPSDQDSPLRCYFSFSQSTNSTARALFVIVLLYFQYIFSTYTCTYLWLNILKLWKSLCPDFQLVGGQLETLRHWDTETLCLASPFPGIFPIHEFQLHYIFSCQYPFVVHFIQQVILL